MSALTYIQLIGFSAGTLLNLFLVILLAGYRRPRASERVLLFLALSLFLFYSGALLGLNLQLYYATPPASTLFFALVLVAAGLGFLPPLLVHLHAAYSGALRGGPRPPGLKALVWAAYLPLAYFALVAFPGLLAGPSLHFLWPGSAVSFTYSIWLAVAVFVAAWFQWRFSRQAAEKKQRSFHRTLAYLFGATGVLVIYAYLWGGLRHPNWSAALGTAAMLASIVPGSLLGYFVLRYNFLDIGGQRNLVYAVSAAFLALLYLAVVRRAETWLEPLLPPDATGSILLFMLVAFFEPLQRWVGRVLRRAFREQVDRLQRLTSEIQQEARGGDLVRLLGFVENRVREEFGLAAVRILLRVGRRAPSPDTEARATPGAARQTFALRNDREKIGVLEATPYGSALSGETYAALEFLAEQLPGALDLCRLIDEKLVLERELAERARLALVGQMAASISHNLKNPLGSMKTVLQVQLEKPELPETLRRDCAMVIAEIDRLSAKLGQLLRYAKPSVRAGGAPQRVAALALVEQQIALLRREAERRQLHLALGYAPGTGDTGEVFVRGSEEALSDVLLNLVVNAIEVLGPGGKICVRLERRDGKLVLEVADDGPGIPSEFRTKIFEPFFTTKPSGTGLGLAIVERRLSEMGGSIRWESPVESGRGTRFTVTLPIVE